MSLLLEQLRSAITPQLVAYAAKMIGEPPAQTDNAINMVLPAMLSGLASATRMPGGLAAVARLIYDPVNDGTLSKQLPALYQGTMTAAPAYRLGSQLLHSIFGSKLGQVTQTAAVLSGVKPAASALLVSTLAPHVVSMLGERLRAGGNDTPAALARLFETERLPIQAALPPEFEHIFGAPLLAHTAPQVATAATGIAASHPAVVAATAAAQASASSAGVANKAKATAAATAADARTRAADSGGSGPWIIFSLGLVFWGLLTSLGSRPNDHERVPAAPVADTAKPAAPKVAEMKPEPAAKAPEAKPAPASKAPEPAPPAAKAPEVKPAAPAANVPETKPAATAKAPEPKSVPAAKPVAEVPAGPPPPPGVTTYFGNTPALLDAPARANPDYRPVVAAEVVAATAAEPAAVAFEPVPGITSYFGPAKPVAEMAAIPNPDYTPAVPDAAAAAAPAPAAAVVEAAASAIAPPPAPGVTTYFGPGTPLKEAAAVPNPDYTPAAPAPAPAPAPAAVVAAAAPAIAPAPAPGVTTYFGPGKPLKEAAAIPNPGYKPAPALPVAPAPAAAPFPAAVACQDTVTAAVKSGLVLFYSAKATLKPASVGTLNRIAAAFQSCRDNGLRIEGHTDNTGNADMNQKLSEARAQKVAQYLVSKGIDISRVSSAGFGLTRPVAPNDSAAHKALNRRIEFIVQNK